jgi:predicted permease
MATLLREVRLAVRRLRKTPGFTMVAVLSLALGLAGNAVLFTIVNSLLFKPLPVAEPERVVALYTSDYSSGPFGSSSYVDARDFREGLPAFDHIVGVSIHPTSLTVNGESARTVLGMVSWDFFSAFGVPLAAGRGFIASEEEPGRPAPVIVLSHALWLARFGGSPEAVGSQVLLGGHPFTVIGVAGPGFTGLLRGIGQDAWVPLGVTPLLKPKSADLISRSDRGILLFGRLAPGATLASAEAQAGVLADRLHQAYPESWRTLAGGSRRISLLPEAKARIAFPDMRAPVEGASLFLFLVVGMILLIACANVANLMLSRATARRRDIAIRRALGGSRSQIVRQFLIESTLVAAAGGGLGLLAAWWIGSMGATLPVPLPVPVTLDLAPDLRVVGFTLGVSLIAGLLLGLGPALQATAPTLSPALKEDAGVGLSPRSRLRGAFVVAQVSGSLLLLVLAALFLRSLSRATKIDPGFAARSALLVTTDLGLSLYDEGRGRAFQQALLDQTRALPGVEAVGLVGQLPLSLGGGRQEITIDGYQPREGEDMEIARTVVGTGYFEALETPLARGRGFTAEDQAGAPGAVVVNESFARRYWPGLDPVGRRMSVDGGETWLTVVGVARDGKYGSLGEAPRPFFYLPLLQFYEERTTLVARTRAEPTAIVVPIRAIIHQLDPTLPIEAVGTLEEHLAFSLLPARLAGWGLAGFGLLGLGLASLGIYGVVAFGVSRREREIGIRMALGARAELVVTLAVREGMLLVLVGLGVGLVLASVAGRLARGLLYGLAPLDPQAFLGATLALGLVALLASWLPARRAARVNPMVALRSE